MILWHQKRNMISPRLTGRPRSNDRMIINGIIYALISGSDGLILLLSDSLFGSNVVYTELESDMRRNVTTILDLCILHQL